MSLLTFGRVVLEAFVDLFTQRKTAGNVINSRSGSNTLRQGVDVENLLSIDSGRLRMPNLATPGWARMGIAYGPYTRANGLAFVVRLRDGDVESNIGGVPEHLAVGWFSSTAPSNPLTDGNAFIFRENGTAAGRISVNGSALVDVVTVLKQNETDLVVVLRATGAAYYAASLNGATQLVDYPNLRPLWIDPTVTTATVYAGIQQRHILAQATRVEACHVTTVAAWNQWYGSAQAADLLTGTGALAGSSAVLGGTWSVPQNAITRSAGGSYNSTNTAVSKGILSNPGAVSGLIVGQFAVSTLAGNNQIRVYFRYTDVNNFWCLTCTASQSNVDRVVTGTDTTFLTSGAAGYLIKGSQTNVLAVLDDGTNLNFFVNGTSLGVLSDTALASNVGVGFGTFDATTTGAVVKATSLEAHARSVALPAVLDLGAPFETLGTTTVITENFTGSAADLAGKTTTTGAGTWTNTDLNGAAGGVIQLTGAGTAKKTTATGTQAAYTVAWATPTYADLSLDVTPDGTAYGQTKACRSGVVFWQDAANFMLVRVFTDDSQTNSAEFELLLSVNGTAPVTERINWATQIMPGALTTLRVLFTGATWVAYRNGEPGISGFGPADINSTYGPLLINRVGIVSLGGDTGSTLDNFAAKQ